MYSRELNVGCMLLDTEAVLGCKVQIYVILGGIDRSGADRALGSPLFDLVLVAISLGVLGGATGVAQNAVRRAFQEGRAMTLPGSGHGLDGCTTHGENVVAVELGAWEQLAVGLEKE